MSISFHRLRSAAILFIVGLFCTTAFVGSVQAQPQASGTLTVTTCTLNSPAATSCFASAQITMSGSFFNCVWLTAPTELIGCSVGSWPANFWLTATQRTLELRSHTGGTPDGSDESRQAGRLLDSELVVAQPFNVAPTVSLTSPAAGSSHVGGQVITLTANAADAGGSISKVEFFDGSTLLNTDTTPPYAYAWSGASSGTHALKAVATDNSAAFTTSAIVSISVNFAPTIALTAPSHGASPIVGESLQLAATASDSDGSIARVEFYLDGNLLNNDASVPYGFLWFPVTAGSHTIKARAVDNLGLAIDSATVTVFGNQRPTVTLVSPVNGAHVFSGQPIALSANAGDVDGSIVRVEFYDGATLLHSDVTAPYGYGWTGAVVGTHSISARTVDNLGAVGVSSVATLTVDQLPPTVALTSPANGAVFAPGQSITLTANAQDADGTIFDVAFVVDGVVLGRDNASPYTMNWSGATGGAHSISAIATDNSGASTTSATIGIVVNTLPTVSITAPAHQSVHAPQQPILLTANASDSDGSVASVAFYDGANLLGTDTSSPYSYNWTTASIGTHSLSARATDNHGGVRNSVVVDLRVNSRPIVGISAPANGSLLSAGGSLLISANAQDGDGSIIRVEFYRNGVLLGSDTSSPYQYTWQPVTSGNHALIARAVDNDQAAVDSTAVNVIGNQAPSVGLTAPVANAQFASGQPITLSASASDADGSIGEVEFYAGAVRLGADSSAPYSFVWSGAAVGSYSITARANDDRGVTSTSAPVQISVNQLPPSVHLTHPTAGMAVLASDLVTMRATASDPDDSVAHVQFIVGAQIMPKTDSTDPYTYDWLPINTGNVNLAAMATDTHGAVTTSATVPVLVHTAPIVRINTPADNAYFDEGLSIPVSIDASDDHGVARLELRFGGAFIAGIDNPPVCAGDASRRCFNWTWTNPPRGVHRLAARAIDTHGVWREAAVQVRSGVAFDPDFNVTLVSPKSGTYGPGPILLVAEVTGNTPINRVRFFDNGQPLGGSVVYSPPYEYEIPSPAIGPHSFHAEVYSEDGEQIASDPVSVSVDEGANRRPIVEVLSPLPGLGLGVGDVITVIVRAEDADGLIQQLHVFARPDGGGAPVFIGARDFDAAAMANLYFIDWKVTQAGSYRVYAVASDGSAQAYSKSAALPTTVQAIKNFESAGADIGVSPENEYGKRVKAASTIAPLTSELFGEQVSLYNGATEFVATDIDLPGNSGLPVRLQRRLSIEERRGKGYLPGFGDWDLDVPYLHGMFSAAHGWTVGNPSLGRCKARSEPRFQHPVFELEEVWHGNFLHLPGQGDSELLLNEHPGVRQKTGEGYPWITTEMVRFSCLDALSEGDGEGFVAETPDGTRYTFDHMVERPTTSLRRSYKVFQKYIHDSGTIGPTLGQANTLYTLLGLGGANGGDIESLLHTMQGALSGIREPRVGELWNEVRLARKRVFIMATRVEDRFGNVVNYDYDSQGRLETISANDGRRIELHHDQHDRIDRVTVPGAPATRTWNYAYRSGERGTLQSLTLPSQPGTPDSIWRFEPQGTGSLNATPETESLIEPDGVEGCPEAPLSSGLYSLVITHPSGASGRFDFDYWRHYRSIGNSGGPGVNCVRFSQYAGAHRLVVPNYFDNWTLRRKEISYPGRSQTWTYGYGVHPQIERHPNAQIDPTYPCDDVNGSGPGYCQHSKIIRVVDPDGNAEDFEFGTMYRDNEGRLLGSKVLAAAEQPGGVREVLRTTTNTHFSESELALENPAFRHQLNGGIDATEYGRSLLPNFDPVRTRIRPVRDTSIIQDGVEFATTQQNWDAIGRSLQFTEASARAPGLLTDPGFTGFSRTRGIEYFDYSTAASAPYGTFWHLGQIAALTEPGNATELQRTTFHPNGLPDKRRLFGRVDRSFEWNGDGTLQWTRDSGESARETRFDDYHRGIPRLITLTDGETLTAAVNDFGDITAVTDQLDRTTSYTLDALGRVRGITYPRGPGETWNNTTINYSRSGVPWQRVETTGNRVSRTTYDGLFHPVLQHDEDSVTGTDIFTARDFDHAGREVFASYPAGTNSAEALTTGTWTQFDALGRVTSVSADSELEIDAASPGPDALVTRVRYLDGFRSERTNALGKITTTRFQAWGSPSYELPIGISEPGGVTTSIERDGYGKPVVMTRSGVWEQQNLSQSRHYLYDDHQRLCANGESETGWNVVQYDALNNVGWNATLPWAGAGQYSGVNACNDIRSAGNASATRAVLEYTPRNQVQRVDHPAGTDDLAYTYYDDGTLHTASTADRNWTYVYNARGLVTHETLATAAHDDFQLNWTYDDNAAPSGLSYPSGLNVAFAPDAFGRPTQAGAFATGVSYHANGAISAFNYGNGIAHSLTLNRRQLPLLLKDTLGTDFLRHEHHYDANGNLTALNGTEQRSLSYDDRDRLTGASTSAYGIEAFEYDPLDNLREATTAAGVRLLTYDSKNRLDSMTLSGQNYNYVFNDRGDVQSRETPFSGASQFIYDNAHRVTGITHDALNAHRNESYQYDAHGLRVRTQRDGGQRYQVYSRNGQLLHVDDSRDGKIDYIYLGNTLVAESTTANGATTATIAYQHSDGRGTPSVETNAPLSGAPVVELSRQWLSSYGERYDGNYSDGPGFTGHATDANTRLSYMQQRYYDPAVGRFLSADPVAADANTGGNFNRYWYADNNPYTYTDPDGRLPILIPVLIFIAKELAAEGIEQATGVPMPTVKNAGRFVARKVVRAARRETLQRSAREGARRQREVMEQLRKENPNASVQNERYLRNADGDIVRDSSGTARRVDHAVIENGRARTIETTSLTADKGLQMQKEQEIINRGGTYIRDKITRELIPVEGLSELRRVK